MSKHDNNQNGGGPRCSRSSTGSLASYVQERKEVLEAEYERHKGDRQMESIISGQLLELDKIPPQFLSANK